MGRKMRNAEHATRRQADKARTLARKAQRQSKYAGA